MVLACVTAAAQAEVTKIEIASRTAILADKQFGSRGAYEKIVGKVFFAVDPDNPHNKAIVDIDKAPRDNSGRVTFSADLYVLAPKDPALGNGVALFDVLNRGRKNIIRNFNRASQVLDPTAAADFGDGFLMRQGYTLVWVGWQFDIPHRDGLMGLDAPPALEQGKPITGRVSTSFTPNTADPVYPLDNLGRYADTTRYPPLDPASPANTLTVRAGFLGSPRTIPRDQWQFGRLKDGQLVSDISALYLEGGYEPGQVYELSYEASGAVVAGVGLAALRDLASAVKHQQAGPLSARYVYAFGPSQDGRLLREFLYEGFNADEQGRRAFDGVISHIAGAGRSTDFNARFARPNGLAFFDASRFPYLDLDQQDPVTGKSDGILMKLEPEQRPKIFYTNSSGEYWGGGRAAALTHITLDGTRDAKVPDNVRIYLFAGTQHVPGGYLPSQGPGQQKPNGNAYVWAHRALLVALDRWIRDDIQPPASAHPTLADKTLVARDQIDFPAIPGLHSPLSIPAGYRADLPGPQSAHPLPLLVPQVDGDGNEVSGIRLPNVAVPLATYTGWNFRSASIGQPDELLPLTGSYIPFPVTKTAREEAHDPRLSIEERYGSRARYEGLVRDAAARLAQDGYLLNEDVQAVVERALANWDEITRATPLAGR
jgi:Alpha/beta hydrolase domain